MVWLSLNQVQLKLTKNLTLLEVGSGTGVFVKHLLEKGYKVICIEPNQEMRDYSKKNLLSSLSIKVTACCIFLETGSFGEI